MALTASFGQRVTVATAVALLGCAGPDSSSTASDSTLAMTGVSTWPARDSAGLAAPHPAPETPPRDADQRFLRRMLDHHETVVAHAHAAMSSEAGHAEHGGGGDPAAFDATLDRDKLAMLALLESVYGERYSPHPADTTGLDFSARLRAGIRLVDENAQHLRRQDVRSIARRIRVTHSTILAQLGSAGHKDKH